MSSIVPLFRNTGFDDAETRNLGKAYDIACRSIHPQGKPPVVQELLAKKIIEVAARGERDPERLAAAALELVSVFHRDVARRFGLFPNFFMSAPDAPEIVEKLWDFAKSAYLDSPIPSLFKERLFVFLSRFCQARYCIVRHCGFLVGYGHSAGDAEAAPQTIEQALKLLRMSPPWRRDLDPVYHGLMAINTRMGPLLTARPKTGYSRLPLWSLSNRRSPSVPRKHCCKHWAANAWSIYLRFSRLLEPRIIGLSFIPDSKPRAMSGR